MSTEAGAQFFQHEVAVAFAVLEQRVQLTGVVTVVLVEGGQHGFSHCSPSFHIAMAFSGRGLFHLAPGTGKADAQSTRQLGTKFDEGGVLNRGHRNQPGIFSIR